jgi:ribosomal protein L22
VKTHLLINVRQCNCGDSFCGDCRTEKEETACGAWPKKPGYLSRDKAKVTCSKCQKTYASEVEHLVERAVVNAECKHCGLGLMLVQGAVFSHICTGKG